MAGVSFTWTLRYQGRAFCAIADDHGQAEVIASDITGGPEYLLRAVTSLARGARITTALNGAAHSPAAMSRRSGPHATTR
jgi:hypothetical protein